MTFEWPVVAAEVNLTCWKAHISMVHGPRSEIGFLFMNLQKLLHLGPGSSSDSGDCNSAAQYGMLMYASLHLHFSKSLVPWDRICKCFIVCSIYACAEQGCNWQQNLLFA